MGHLNIVDIPGDSTLFSTHHLVYNTPIIFISYETMLLGQEDGQTFAKTEAPLGASHRGPCQVLCTVRVVFLCTLCMADMLVQPGRGALPSPH